MTPNEIRHIAKLKAEELHEEWLEARIGSKLSDGDLERELFNDDIGESVLQEELALGRLNKSQTLNAETDLMFIALKRRSYAQLRNPENLLLSTETSKIQKSPNKRPEILISDKLEAFIEDKRAKRSSIKDASLKEYRLAVQELIDILGDINVLDIRYVEAVNYRETMRKLPKHRNISKAYRSKTIQELLELDIPDKDLLSAKTINDRLSQLSSYFDWLERCEDIKKNPFRNLRIETNVTSYVSYKTNDLKDIFSSPIYVNSPYSRRKTTTQSHWWLIILGAFTGARIGELMQMRLEDITESDGILSMTVTDEGEGMSTKTSAGKRKFPVLPILLTLGFREYVEAMKKTTATTLLPDIAIGKDKAGSIASNWFGRYKQKHLSSSLNQKGKVFHSFRHTFISNALKCDIDITKLQQIVGHESKILAETETYKGDGYSQEQLLRELNKFEYKDLDIKTLKNDWRRLNIMK